MNSPHNPNTRTLINTLNRPAQTGIGGAVENIRQEGDDTAHILTEKAAEHTAGAATKKLMIQTWGCQMNVYDSERIADVLRPLGYSLTQKMDEADMVVLNTCHIREKASEKVYSEIGRIKEIKDARAENGQETSLVVAGCVAQAEGAEMMSRAPSVDMVIGPQAYHRLPELIAKTVRKRGEKLDTGFDPIEKFDALPIERQKDGPTAFLSIQEGCDKFCAFCVVPYTRGAEYSRDADPIVAEARGLAANGVREITLLGQNVNAWHGAAPAGLGEKETRWTLGQLIRHLAKIDPIARLRFTTSHPNDMDDDLIAAFGDEPKLMPFLHLPVQSGSDKILKAMNRKHNRAQYIATMAAIKHARPDIAFASDFIVGFPGETDADFEDTMDLVRTIGFAQAYSFKYSRRPGTPAADSGKQVAEDVKDGRLQALQALLNAQQLAFNESQIGKILPVLFTNKGRNEGQIGGKSPYLQAVHCDGPMSLIGQIADVKITAASKNSISGHLVRSHWAIDDLASVMA